MATFASVNILLLVSDLIWLLLGLEYPRMCLIETKYNGLNGLRTDAHSRKGLTYMVHNLLASRWNFCMPFLHCVHQIIYRKGSPLFRPAFDDYLYVGTDYEILDETLVKCMKGLTKLSISK